jgi:hypothetical protein
MKHLQDYQDKAQNVLFDKLGAFFAFNNEQFKKGLDSNKLNGILLEGEKLTECGAGMYAPTKNKKELFEGINSIYKGAIAKDIKANGKDKIIIRELYNYECFYTGDVSDAVDSLKPYGFTSDDICKAYAKEYPEYEKHNC